MLLFIIYAGLDQEQQAVENCTEFPLMQADDVFLMWSEESYEKNAKA
jgi:hypothetical protein